MRENNIVNHKRNFINFTIFSIIGIGLSFSTHETAQSVDYLMGIYAGGIMFPITIGFILGAIDPYRKVGVSFFL